MRVYIEQYGGWWSLSWEEWMGLVDWAIEDGGFSLEGYRELRSRPGCVRGSQQMGHWVHSGDHLCFNPLDWEIDYFRYVRGNEYRE